MAWNGTAPTRFDEEDSMGTLLKNATVLTLDAEHGTEPWQADVLVEGDHIAAIGPGPSGHSLRQS